MKKNICLRETEIINKLKVGPLQPEIQEHVSECPFCKEAVSVYLWMNQFKNISWEVEAAKKNLPSSESIWKRAYPPYKPYKDLVKRALRPLIFSRWLAFGTTLVGITLFLLSIRQDIQHFIEAYFSLNTTLPLILTSIVPMIIVSLSISFCILINAFEKRKRNQLT